MQTESFPLISVVMATYNGEKYLSQQLDSLLAQTYPNFEIIISDDASRDTTNSILEQYKNLHSKIHIHYNKENLGFIKNFGRAISLSNGSLIALCDQDDIWHPEKLSSQFNGLGKAALIYCDAAICNDTLQPTGKLVSTISNCLDYNSCLQQAVFCRIYGNTMLFKKNILQGAADFPACLPHDWWIAFLASDRGGIKFCNQVLVEYRQHANNAIGAATGKGRKKSRKEKYAIKQKELTAIRERMMLFYLTCADEHHFEKKALKLLNRSYHDFSISSNLLRLYCYLKYSHWLLAVKRRSTIRKLFFCLKMFFKIK